MGSASLPGQPSSVFTKMPVPARAVGAVCTTSRSTLSPGSAQRRAHPERRPTPRCPRAAPHDARFDCATFPAPLPARSRYPGVDGLAPPADAAAQLDDASSWCWPAPNPGRRFSHIQANDLVPDGCKAPRARPIPRAPPMRRPRWPSLAVHRPFSLKWLTWRSRCIERASRASRSTAIPPPATGSSATTMLAASKQLHRLRKNPSRVIQSRAANSAAKNHRTARSTFSSSSSWL